MSLAKIQGGHMTNKQNSDAPNSAKNDPNMAGTQETSPVRDELARAMTPSDEYSQDTPFYGDFKSNN
jgi:hypothetical protein